MKKSKAAILLCFLLSFSFSLLAQEDSLKFNNVSGEVDTTIVQKEHSPVRASIYSMVLPGLGQAYNRKYWKMPLVYAGIGIPLYYGIIERNEFIDARDAYRRRLDNDTTAEFSDFSDDALLEFVDAKRYNRDLLFIISSVVYVLNIVDASVDAHFFDFNVSNDLSLHWQPQFYRSDLARNGDQTYIKGVTLTLNFK